MNKNIRYRFIHANKNPLYQQIGYLFQYMGYRFVYKMFKLRYAIFSH